MKPDRRKAYVPRCNIKGHWAIRYDQRRKGERRKGKERRVGMGAQAGRRKLMERRKV